MRRIPRLAVRVPAHYLTAVALAGAVFVKAHDATAQLAAGNVPLPNVMLLIDTSGSMEQMVDGSLPEAGGPTGNNPNASTGLYSDCTQGLYQSLTTGTASTAPNKWGVLMQAMTGNVQPYFSCINENRASPAFVQQYGIRLGAGDATLQTPYDFQYYLPFHRPASVTGTAVAASACVVTPNALPGYPLPGGGVGFANLGVGGPNFGGITTATDCNGAACDATGFPTDSIGQFLYDGVPLNVANPGGPGQLLTTANGSIASGPWTMGLNHGGPQTTSLTLNTPTTACTFQQDNTGILTAESTIMRFGLMTFDNDTEPGTGVAGAPLEVAPTPLFSTDTKSPFDGNWSYFPGWKTWIGFPGSGPPLGGGACFPDFGAPTGCSTLSAFEVGARNSAAPPWEGRLIGFPPPTADSTGTNQANQVIQSAFRALRPYGATPTAGLMTDAEYYLWKDPVGPGQTDDFVRGGCRQQNIVLITDGAPNLDLRNGAGCNTAANAMTPPALPGPGCPYPLPEDTAAALYAGTESSPISPNQGANGKQVLTYVIGFAVSDQVTGLIVNCQQLAQNNQLTAICGAPTKGVAGSGNPAAVDYNSPCCSLQRIAVAGGTGRAYFADTPGDLAAAVASVVGQISGQLTSQTLPAYSPAVTYVSGSNQGTSYSFSSSFDGQGVPWTGDIQRDANTCIANVPTPQPIGAIASVLAPPGGPCTIGNGDDFECDLQTQSVGNTRSFLAFSANQAVLGDTNAAGSYTIRPYLGTGSHQLDALDATVDEVGLFGTIGGSAEVWGHGAVALGALQAAFTPNMLNIQPGACQDPIPQLNGLGLPFYPALTAVDCETVALSFEIATASVTTPSDIAFPNIYNSPGVPGVPGLNRSLAPFGGILHSTPIVDGPPAALIRDDSYQAFAMALSPQALNGSPAGPRDMMLYVATSDGLLHAFDTSFVPGVSPSSTLPGAEAWAFIPPAVMTGLVPDYPAANKVLLDGSPHVKDVVFTRCAGSQAGCSTANWINDWHTMLVAGMGAGGRGYYALDVTDPRTSHVTPPNFSSYPTTAATLTGPHFQWQFTSVNPPPGSIPNRFPANQQTELFGSTSGTPTIATVYIQPTAGGIIEEVGVAILPGGSNGPPVPGTCARELPGAITAGTFGFNYAASAEPVADTTLSGGPPPVRGQVRQWAGSIPGTGVGITGCSGHGTNVPGRNLTIVSIATGEIIAVFARGKPSTYVVGDSTTWDVPTDINGNPVVGHLIPTPFDSPITGTPVVFPSDVGAIAQHIYVGDADGTMWRVDISSTDPTQWSAAIMADAFWGGAANFGDTGTVSSYNGASPTWNAALGLTPAQNQAYDSQPIVVTPVITLDQQGVPTVSFATGDQSALTSTYTIPGTSLTNPVTNFVYSVADTVDARAGGATTPTATVRWEMPFINGERVTGPMAVFNNTLYYATYLPPGNVASACSSSGLPSLWGVDFVNSNIGKCANRSCGGNPLDYTPTSGDIATCSGASASVWGQCLSPLDSNNVASVGVVIPGVTVAVAPACATISAPGVDSYTGGSHITASGGNTGATYSLVAQVKGSNHGTNSVNTVTTKLKTPTSDTIVDSWAAVIE